METMCERYTEEMRSQFDYLSTWLPNAHLELGDVGVLHRDRFERLTSLSDIGIPFTIRERHHAVDLDYCSASNVSIRVTGAADGLSPAPLRMSVSFTREHGVVFQAKECHVTEIANRYTLGRNILALAESGLWPRDHVVITELVSTGPAVVLISNQRDARIELVTHAPVPAANVLPLASASATLDVVSARGIGVKIIASRGLTPLFRASGLRRRLLGQDQFGHRGGNADITLTAKSDGPAEFAELTYEDLV